jgi:DNA-binding CsgD family transcriptional regulator
MSDGSRYATSKIMRKLSVRETQVLAFVAAGKTTKEISASLGISESTVNWHIANILTKLEASSRAEAVSAAYRERLLPDPGSQLVADPVKVVARPVSPRREVQARRRANLSVLGVSLAHLTVETWVEPEE